MSESSSMPKGFICTKCGTRNNYPAYVAAHWRDLLTHTCACGAKHDVMMGRATRKGPRRTKAEVYHA